MQSNLEEQFHAAMLNIYEQGTRLKPSYRATRFRQMVLSLGGKAAADQLLSAPGVSDGFTELFLRGPENLRLSVEYVVLQEPWRPLFTDEQRAVARKRLHDMGVELPEGAA
ncbi:MAG: hypothetical protein ACREP4_13880 [Stenotrophomonas sp.]|uniref:hypothetical protein n=1 Tax=Stenotrophomonas sp. TaxID=69392 RepID=UPI003D6CAF00